MGQLEDISKLVVESASQTYEQLAFSELIVADDDFCNHLDQLISVKIDILLPYLGDIWILTHPKLAQNIALNLFQDASESTILDAAQEYLNIFSGLLMQKLMPNVLFELGIPMLLPYPDFNSYHLIALKNEEGFPLIIANKIHTKRPA